MVSRGKGKAVFIKGVYRLFTTLTQGGSSMQLTSDDLILTLMVHPVIQATSEESNTTLPILI